MEDKSYISQGCLQNASNLEILKWFLQPINLSALPVVPAWRFSITKCLLEIVSFQRLLGGYSTISLAQYLSTLSTLSTINLVENGSRFSSKMFVYGLLKRERERFEKMRGIAQQKRRHSRMVFDERYSQLGILTRFAHAISGRKHWKTLTESQSNLLLGALVHHFLSFSLVAHREALVSLQGSAGSRT